MHGCSVDQQAAQPGGQRRFARVLPQCIARDVGDDDLALQVYGGRARTIAGGDRDSFHRRA